MIYVFLADGFEEVEAVTPIDLMRRAGLSVKTVGLAENRAVGSHGIEVKTDVLLSQVSLEDAEMLVLPGGPGHEKLKALNSLLLEADRRSIPLAAICAAPSVLGELGILNGKKGTCFPGYEVKCKDMIYTGDACVTDGRVITSRGAGTAQQFALAIVTYLCGKTKSDAIKAAIQA